MHLSICIATYKRPQLLRRLFIESLCTQICEGKFTYSIHICDNDADGTAKSIYDEFKDFMDITYDVEPTQNISLARNRSLERATGDYVVFRDDDDIWSETNWLKSLLECALEFNADVVVGPNEITLSPSAAKFLKSCDAFKAAVLPRGLADHMPVGTGNSLVRRSLISNQPFDIKLGLTGKEDLDFFIRLRENGARFAWCPEARIKGELHADRSTVSYTIRRRFQRGGMYAKINEQYYPRLNWCRTLIMLAKSIALSFLLVILVPVAALFPSIFVRFAAKTAYHYGYCYFAVRGRTFEDYHNPVVALGG